MDFSLCREPSDKIFNVLTFLKRDIILKKLMFASNNTISRLPMNQFNF